MSREESGLIHSFSYYTVISCCMLYTHTYYIHKYLHISKKSISQSSIISSVSAIYITLSYTHIIIHEIHINIYIYHTISDMYMCLYIISVSVANVTISLN